MTETLQTLQLILFAIPVVVLMGLGAVILVRPVSVVSRRWFLGVFLPLLLANPLALLEDNVQVGGPAVFGWRFWVILIANLVMVVWIVYSFRGFTVYGLTQEEVLTHLTAMLTEQGGSVTSRQGERSSLMGKAREGRVLTFEYEGGVEEIWIAEHFYEVHIRAESAVGRRYLRGAFASLRKMQKPYNFSRHAMGILFNILAVVFAVFSWIFFFEPRLILIE